LFIGKATPICTARYNALENWGKRVGVAINPATPVGVLEEVMQDIEQVLVMTVDPGFGHQHFLPTTLQKIRRVRQMIEQISPECDLEVDGGIDAKTAPLAVGAGANVLIAGTAIFGEGEEVGAAMGRLRAGVKQFCKRETNTVTISEKE
jgi:ribulose-phosphate 3-epimerase